MSQTATLLQSLKKVLKVKGLTYGDVARGLGVSEPSIKRIFNESTSVTLSRLEEICGFIGMDLFDLVKLGRRALAEDNRHLNEEQELELAADQRFFVFFYALIKGLTVKMITTKYAISEDEADHYLVRLDKLGLIEYSRRFEFRLLVSPAVEWDETGPLASMYMQDLSKEFLSHPFDGQGDLFKPIAGQLSEKSQAMMAEKVSRIVNEIRELSQIDKAINTGEGRTVVFLFAAREWIPSFFNEYQREPATL